MNNIIAAIILGIVQGIAEFLPISSSAHLIIFRDVFGIGKGMGSDLALCFDLALHLGTLLAIAVFFFKDFLNMVVKGVTKGVKDKEGKIFFQIIVATIPAAIAGLLFEDVIEDAIRTNYYLIALALILMGIIIYVVDKKSKEEKEVKKGRARGRSRKIKEADVLAENTAQTVINEASEIAPVIAENAAIKPDEPEQPAEVQSEVKAEEPEAEAKPAKRTRRPNRNSQKRTRKPVKKDAEE